MTTFRSMFFNLQFSRQAAWSYEIDEYRSSALFLQGFVDASRRYDRMAASEARAEYRALKRAHWLMDHI